MIKEYKYGERCFLINDKSILDTVVPVELLAPFGYSESKVLRDILQTWKELPNGSIAHDVQIAPESNNKLGSTAANKPMTKQQFDLAKLQYKVREFYSIEEYKELTPNEILI